MGYACPVCEDPQADAGHLANHLAFTAILGDDAHGAWLDENVPGWGEMGESELADALRGSVEETEFPQVFEDTVGGLSESDESPIERSGALFDDAVEEGDDHDPGGQHAHSPGGDRQDTPGVGPGGPPDDETAAILEEAREMTRAMLGTDEEDEDGTGAGGGPTDSDGATAADSGEATGTDIAADSDRERGGDDSRGDDSRGDGVDGNENG